MSCNAKKRLVFTSHTGRVSGAERVLLGILRGLDRERYEPFVVCPEDGGLHTAVVAEGISYLPIPSLRARFTWNPVRLLGYVFSIAQSMLLVRRRILDLDPDLVHANSPRAGIVATLATAGTSKTVVWHVHDILPRHPVSVVVRLLAYLSRRTQVIAVSDATAEAFSSRLPFKNRIQTIHNGVDLSCFPRKQPGDVEFKRRLGIPEGSFLVCAVGQICARKGLMELSQAFAQSYASTPSMHLAIVGKVVFEHEKPYGEQLLAYVTRTKISSRVHFAGEVRDAAAVLRGADLLVLNSLEEPFGLVLVEAMASGTPVLASRVGGIPEIVIHGTNGWLVERGDIVGLSRKLVELSQSPDDLKRTAEIAFLNTCPRFSLERFHRNLHVFYAELDARAADNRSIARATALVRDESK